MTKCKICQLERELTVCDNCHHDIFMTAIDKVFEEKFDAKVDRRLSNIEIELKCLKESIVAFLTKQKIKLKLKKPEVDLAMGDLW